MKKKLLPLGFKFNRLTCIGLGIYRGHNHLWECECDCLPKTQTFVTAANLFSGQIKSCGCWNLEAIVARSTKHGHNRRGKTTPEYKAWQHMISRCYNTNDRAYHYYGGRGIHVCPPWLDSFTKFLADLGQRPSKYYSLDRVDVNGDYAPNNCRWATRLEQRWNRRDPVILLKFDHKRLSLEDWSTETGIKYPTLLYRVRHGWSVKEVLTTPVRTKKLIS